MNLSKEEIRNFKLENTFSRQIVNEINLVDIAISYGYINKSPKSSANWVVLENNTTKDKIIINKNNNNQWYFNSNDDLDKGKAFNFILNRIDGNLNVLSNPTGFEKRTAYVIAAKFLNKSSAVNHTLQNEIKSKKTEGHKEERTLKTLDFINKDFLKHRGISIKTLNSPFFKNRIFNSKVPGKNNGMITNTAFPLFNVHTSKIEGWTTRNKKYTNKNNQLINPTYFFGNTNALWFSNTPKDLKKICFAESEIDALSHFDLNPNNHTLYVSFDGNLNPEKQNNLIEFFEKHLRKNPNINIVSITDNDLIGYSYDMKVLTDLINRNNPDYNISFVKRKDFFEFEISPKNQNIDIKNEWKKFIQDFNQINKIQKKTIEATIFTKNLKTPIYSVKFNTNNDLIHLNSLFKILKDKYLPNIAVDIKKSIHRDWNDDLNLKTNKKKNKQLKI